MKYSEWPKPEAYLRKRGNSYEICEELTLKIGAWYDQNFNSLTWSMDP